MEFRSAIYTYRRLLKHRIDVLFHCFWFDNQENDFLLMTLYIWFLLRKTTRYYVVTSSIRLLLLTKHSSANEWMKLQLNMASRMHKILVNKHGVSLCHLCKTKRALNVEWILNELTFGFRRRGLILFFSMPFGNRIKIDEKLRAWKANVLVFLHCYKMHILRV